MRYFTITESMTKLGLDLRETIAFAVIYTFSQNGDGVWFGSVNTMKQWLLCESKVTVHKVLKSLVDKGLVAKRRHNEHGTWRVEYAATAEAISKLSQASNTEFNICTQSVQKMNSVGTDTVLSQFNSCTQSVQKLNADNKDYNKDYKKEDNARTHASEGKGLAATRSKEGDKKEPSPAPSLRRFVLLVSDDGSEWLKAAFIGSSESDELRKRRHIDANGMEWKFVKKDNTAIYEN